MSCIKINNGIICSGTLSIQEISLSDGYEYGYHLGQQIYKPW